MIATVSREPGLIDRPIPREYKLVATTRGLTSGSLNG